jgi:Ca-activated chloride channel family protein
MPKSHVVSLSLECDRESIAGEEPSKVHVVAELRAVAEGVEHARPPLCTVFAVDASGSMQGPPIDQVIRSIDRLVDLLEDKDRVGVVAFSHGATEVCALAPMTAEGKRALRQRTRRLEADGGTNMEAGLRLAKNLLGSRAQHERQVVLLLSDGAPNQGASSAADLAAIVAPMRPDVSISSLGYGVSHNEAILSAISDAGGGRYHFIADPDMCQLELAQALGAAGDMVAGGLELLLVPAQGVEIVRILGEPKTRFGAAGLVVPLPDMRGGERRLLVLELAVAPGAVERLHGDLLGAKLTYRRAGGAEPRGLEQRLGVPVTRSLGALAPLVHGKVLLARSEEVRAAARALADRGQFDGAAAHLRALIKEIEAAPGYVAADGSALSEACELLVDEAMAMERRPSAEQYNLFKKGTHGVSLMGDAVRAGRVNQGAYGKALASATAGIFPTAHVVVVSGPSAGARHLLGPECTIGRTSSADIQVHSPAVSRRHTSIYALHGEFWVADLGSTNPTLVNGQPLAQKPHKLALGDVIGLGDVKLRYEVEVK